MILYPKVAVKGQSYKGHKRLTVPDQSMSLHEIIRRFTRKESLPIEMEGTYDTRFGDLGKLKDMDLTEQAEQIEYIRGSVRKFEERQKAELEKRKEVLEKPPVSPPVPSVEKQ